MLKKNNKTCCRKSFSVFNLAPWREKKNQLNNVLFYFKIHEKGFFHLKFFSHDNLLILSTNVIIYCKAFKKGQKLFFKENLSKTKIYFLVKISMD